MKISVKEREHFRVVSKSKALRNHMYPGALIHYKYNPITRDLPFWDKHPTIIVLWKTKRHMLGVNIHFIPIGMRKIILNYLIKVNRTRIKNGKRMVADYKMFKGLLKKLNAQMTIRKYLIRRIQGDIAVPLSNKDYIFAATNLDTKKLYGVESENIYAYLVKKQKIAKTRTLKRKRRELRYK